VLLSVCPAHKPTPLYPLPALAAAHGGHSINIMDEGQRWLKSFKALGGAYAVINLVLSEAAARLGRSVEPQELQTAAVKAIANTMTVTCANNGNHGKRLDGCV
jgi:diaminopropionate ammonia-lyase